MAATALLLASQWRIGPPLVLVHGARGHRVQVSGPRLHLVSRSTVHRDDHAVVDRLRRAEDGQLKVAAAQTAHEAERELVRLDLTHELAPEARRNPTLLEDTGGGGLELRPPGRRDIDGHGLRVEEEAKQHGLALHREIALRFLHAPVEVAEQLHNLGAFAMRRRLRFWPMEPPKSST